MAKSRCAASQNTSMHIWCTKKPRLEQTKLLFTMKSTRREVATMNPRRKPRNSSSQAVKSRLTVSLIGSRPLIPCLALSISRSRSIYVIKLTSAATSVATLVDSLPLPLKMSWFVYILSGGNSFQRQKWFIVIVLHHFSLILLPFFMFLYAKLNNN